MAQVKAGRARKPAQLTVRMLITCEAPNMRCRPGDVITTDFATAQGWLEAGEAEPVATMPNERAERR